MTSARPASGSATGRACWPTTTSDRNERLVFATYFGAGVRVYDLADPRHPAEIAHWVPGPPPGQPVPQINDLFVDSSGLIWAPTGSAAASTCWPPSPPWRP